ncbi:MAG: DMT family transporter [Anaerolineae bacterium]|nr:DMT family transporter [Anaerolineae bacterium]
MTTSTSVPRTTPAIPTKAFVVIGMGILAISLASIFIKLAQQEGVPSLLIAAGRMTIAALVLTPVTLRRHWNDLQRIGRSEVLFGGLSGLFLAIHFATWILSFEYTSVLVSVVLVTTNPLWAALLEMVFLRARLGRLVILGLIVGVLGSIMVAFPPTGAISLGQNPLLGSALALTGAVAVAVYFVLGRKLRAGLPLLPYIWLVYSSAAIILIIVVIVARIPITGYSASGYFWLVAMALIPQLIGHSSFNYVLKFLPASYVGIASQLEPVLSAIIAFFLFRESPAALQIAGSGIILTGVILASLGQSRSSQETASA